MEFNVIGSQVTVGLYSDSAILQKSVMWMENTLFLPTTRKKYKGSVRNLKNERKKKSWNCSLHLTFYMRAKPRPWQSHLMLNPFINHRKTCLLCSLAKIWVLVTPCMVSVLSVWEWISPHQCSSKCSPPGHESRYCFCLQSSPGMQGRDERVKAVSGIQEVQ